ncbi:MAG: 1,4-dihydroxy-2-naphthoate polyprenyltransferase [Acidobacteria bacterium]|nr:1,4-dihydroxy-2-naphthoate polyprenyltransferase [Acidobacteriota bacterium]
MTELETRTGPFNAWLLAARPKTLWAAVAPVVVGTACAWAVGGFRWLPAVACLSVALWVQIGTNFANDVFDFEKGADTGERLGPTRAVQAGLLTAEQMRRGMWLAFSFCFLSGLVLVWAGGWPMLVLGVASILSGLAYTGGPFPLAYNGLGDLFVLIFFGFVAVVGTAYVQVGHVPEEAWWASVPVGALATAILVVNNLRDRHTDARAGKRTLAVRFGASFTKAEYVLLLLAAYTAPPLLWWKQLVAAWILLPLLTLPLGARLLTRVFRDEGRALNPSLGATAQLLLLFSLLLAAGLVVR